MADRFTRLFSSAKNLYTEGAPVIIAAGALLKDKETGKVLAQLKFRNISNKTIRSLKARVIAKDSAGRLLDEVTDQEYLDVAAARDAEFGQKTAIFLSNASTRAFDAEVIEVVFSDNNIWTPEGAVWEPMPVQTVIDDKEDLKQYRIHFGQRASYMARPYKDLWLCACGAVNHEHERLCHACGNHYEIINCNWEELREEKNLRLQQEREAAEKALAEKKRKARKQRKKLMIILAVLIVAIGGACAAHFYFIPRAKEAKAISLVEAGKYEEAYAIWKELGNAEAIAANKRERAEALLRAEDYEAAYALLTELGDRDTIIKNQYERAEALIRSGDYASAYKLYEELGDKNAVLQNKYDRAMELIAKAEYSAAWDLLDGLHFNDSEYQKQQIEVRVYYLEAEVGDEIVFGSYEQDGYGANGKEDIEWIVLAKEGKKILLISKYALDCRSFNRKKTETSWETCTVREWLNSAFINAAFNAEEQALLSSVVVSADKNPNSGVDPGKDTEDRVFLLSILEAEKYFASDSARACSPTAYAKANGAEVGNRGGGWWWLRSPGDAEGGISGVGRNGGISYSGVSADYDKNAVRPALWLDLGM